MLNQRGFTIFELLVAIMLIAVISTVIATSANVAKRNSEDSQRRSDIKKIQLAMQQYFIDQGHYPLCCYPDAATQLDNCTGNVADSGYAPDLHNCIGTHPGTGPTACIPARVYLNNFPHDPYDNHADIHYCYVAYTQYTAGNSPTANECEPTANDPTALPSRCMYYKLYAPQDGPTPITCHDPRGDHLRMRSVTDPSGQIGP